MCFVCVLLCRCGAPCDSPPRDGGTGLTDHHPRPGHSPAVRPQLLTSPQVIQISNKSKRTSKQATQQTNKRKYISKGRSAAPQHIYRSLVVRCKLPVDQAPTGAFVVLLLLLMTTTKAPVGTCKPLVPTSYRVSVQTKLELRVTLLNRNAGILYAKKS